MRIGQLQALDEIELALLLYILNEVEPPSPKIEITKNLLLFYKTDVLLDKLFKVEPKLNEEGKKVLHSTAATLRKTWLDEIKENNENTEKAKSLQPEFQF